MRLCFRRSSVRLLVAAVLAVSGAVCILPSAALRAATPTDLFISEYIEGSSNNKAIEIYNGTGSAHRSGELAATTFRCSSTAARLQR